jgi:preflagellin peptidase FlaK
MSGLALLFFFVGLYGGADAKALICLSLALPLNPMNLILRNTGPDILFPLGVFSNGVILAALSFVYPLFCNLRWRLKNDKGLFEGFEGESKVRKLAVLISGYKIPMQGFEKNSFSLPLEDVQVSEAGKTERKLVVLPDIEETEEAAQRIIDARAHGGKIDWVWVTPGLPMLVFITAGLISALFLGNFVLIVLTHLLG